VSALPFDPAELLVLWHDVENGSYEADLAVWERLADDAAGPVLDLGCGSGRVALHLARRGHPVTGLDISPELADAVNRRAAAEELPAQALTGDVRALDLGRRFPLVIAPMQLIQVLGGEPERIACMSSISRHLASGGRAAIALAPRIDLAEGGDHQPLPDVRETGSWICSSLPLAVRPAADGVLVLRLRQTVSPEGEIREERNEFHLHRLSVDRLASEAAEAGLELAEEIEVPATDDYVGSVVAILEAR
jgi:SAM-dependent methyltransferase